MTTRGGALPARSQPSAPRVVLRRGREARARAGHLWVYAGEIEKVSGRPEPGAIVEVTDTRGKFLGRGYYNPRSTIAVRILSHERDEAIDATLLRRRIAQAVAWRRQIYDPADVCRLIFSEGDLLPGLTVDRYGSWLALQIGTLGMERMRDDVIQALQDAVHPRGIYERSDAPVRVHEGLPARTGLVAGEVPDLIEVSIDGLQFEVPLKEGQKTGLYLDHRANRRALQAHARGRRMLDVFCNAAAFSLYALKGGATSALGLDSAAESVAAAARNAARNGFSEQCRFVEGNAFDEMKALEKKGERFDLIVLDPPAFTKSAKAVDAARRGYKEINLRALRLASPGAVILTASCSFHLGPEEFLEIVREAAADAGKGVVLMSQGGQALDHPINLAVPETRYLKTLLLAVRN